MTSSTVSRWPRQIAGLGAIACLAVGGFLLRNWRLRYELTIEVETPEGRRRGSSVIVATVRRSVPFWGASGSNLDIQGQAPSVELADGRLVFALLHDSTNVSLPGLAAIDTHTLPTTPDRLPRMNAGAIWSQLKARRPVMRVDAATMRRRMGSGAGACYPDIVVLNPADPTSIRAIDPANAEDALGPGFSLTALELRIVDAPLDALSELPWLPGVSSVLDRMASSTGPLRNSLNPARFVARGRSGA